MGARGQKHSARTRERQRRGSLRAWELRRARESVFPAYLKKLIRSGLVAPPYRPLLVTAASEVYELTESLGGADQISTQRRLLIEDVASTGLAMRAVLTLLLQDNGGDTGELASRVGTLSASRRASLVALGLDRHQREISLGDYLATKPSNGSQSKATPITIDQGDRPAERNTEPLSASADESRVGAPPASEAASTPAVKVDAPGCQDEQVGNQVGELHEGEPIGPEDEVDLS